jgi:dTDP-4-amino-4,6-dideoxygalactose transaminase
MSFGQASTVNPSGTNPFTQDPSEIDDRAGIPLSVPHPTGGEVEALARAVASNWLGPVGPEVAAFEEEFARAVGADHALATTSGTAALHLCLRVLGVGPGDEVLVSTLTFCASVNPVLYLGATPVFVDAELESWNMDPALLAAELDRRGREGQLPAAVVVVHLFGQVADLNPIVEACRRWNVPLVEDAAEALGASHDAGSAGPRAAGTVGDMGIYSFDASKMITTSMGGMLVSARKDLVEHARKLARQAREPAAHYEHVELGYNYRMSNLLAAVGRVQLAALPDRVSARRAVFSGYRSGLEGLPGIRLQPEAAWGTHARWLTCIRVDPSEAGVDREAVRIALQKEGIESRPVWKPMHLQPLYRAQGIECLGGNAAERLFDEGLCLPSSSSLTPQEVARVCAVIRRNVSG